MVLHYLCIFCKAFKYVFPEEFYRFKVLAETQLAQIKIKVLLLFENTPDNYHSQAHNMYKAYHNLESF